MKSSRRTNESHTGWYVAVIIERFEYYDEDVSNPDRECEAHENLVLIHADKAAQAYERAVEIGKTCEGIECINDVTRRKGEWRFVGVNELLPVYDDLADGAEIMWTKHVGVTVASVEGMAKLKSEFGGFSPRKWHRMTGKNSRGTNILSRHETAEIRVRPESVV